VQDLVDRLVARGLSASTVRNSILPLRAIYRRVVSRSEVLVNPTLGLALPAVRGRRERVARPSEAHALLQALSVEDRAIWATALYAGLRRGELQGLRWSDIDFEAGIIRVERSWDEQVAPVAPKSRAGRRRVHAARPPPDKRWSSQVVARERFRPRPCYPARFHAVRERSSITVTLDRYGHLMPGEEAQAADMLVSYLEREPGL
jgi:integrase